jgi:patatin-like phospholipase/acyl hydrolase
MSKLKSKIVSVVVGVLVAGALVGAQTAQSPAKIKKVRQQINLAQDLKVGSTVLKSGRYEVSSDDQGLTFRHMVPDSAYADQWIRDNKVKPVVVKATATVLEAKNRGMQMDVVADSSGVAVLKAISLDDTNLKFTIAQ